MKRFFQAVLAVVVAVAASAAAASERHFTYTYESSVLQPGAREIEPWNTFRLGRSGFYSRLDSRLEFELGLTDRLQTALYLNLKSVTADSSLGRTSSSELGGVSSEWKLKLADPVADRAGVALYGELSAGPSELELEGKLILDKRVGRLLGALNLVAEHEWKFDEPETQRETALELDAAACWFLTPRLTAGLELRSHTVLPRKGRSHPLGTLPRADAVLRAGALVGRRLGPAPDPRAGWGERRPPRARGARARRAARPVRPGVLTCARSGVLARSWPRALGATVACAAALRHASLRRTPCAWPRAGRGRRSKTSAWPGACTFDAAPAATT